MILKLSFSLEPNLIMISGLLLFLVQAFFIPLWTSYIVLHGITNYTWVPSLLFGMMSEDAMLKLAILSSSVGDAVIGIDPLRSLVPFGLFHIITYFYQKLNYVYNSTQYPYLFYVVCPMTLLYYPWVGNIALYCFIYSILLAANLVTILTNSQTNPSLSVAYISYVISDAIVFINLHYDNTILRFIALNLYYQSILVLSGKMTN
jgi:hypothetical protein